MRVLIACALLVSSPCSRLTGDDRTGWTGWLGPERNGWVAGFEAPEPWPAKLTKRWRVTVGAGYGSPVVSGGRVWQHARQGEDEVVWCIDLKSGDVKWSKRFEVPFKMGGGGERHGKGPKSCPVLSDGKLFTMSITGVLRAWSAETGELLWRRDYSSQFKKGHPYWGASASPLVDGERVVVHFGTDGEGVLAAIDVDSGKQVWEQGKDAPSYSSPLLAEIDGVRQVIDWNQRVLAGVEAETGTLLWEYPFPQVKTDQNMPTPAVHEGLVIVGAENRGVHAFRPKKRDGRWSVEKVWSQDSVALDMCSAVINGELLYGLSHYDKGRIFCLDIETGKVLWRGPGRTGANVTFLAIPGHVLALLDGGELKVIHASGEKFKELASWEVASSPTWAPPVLVDGGVLVKDRETLTLWSFAAE